MSSQQFNLLSDWEVAASTERVWAELVAPEHWPQWWRAVKRVELLREGDAEGVGAERRFTWTSALPYQVRFDMRVTRVEPMRVIEGRASGELNGMGRWTLSPTAAGTHVRYEWVVELRRPWMRALAPLLRPVFAWNHHVVMGWGLTDLRKRLAPAP